MKKFESLAAEAHMIIGLGLFAACVRLVKGGRGAAVRYFVENLTSELGKNPTVQTVAQLVKTVSNLSKVPWKLKRYNAHSLNVDVRHAVYIRFGQNNCEKAYICAV